MLIELASAHSTPSTCAGVIALLFTTSALAVPPVPALRTPTDGGWVQRSADLQATMAPRIPADVPAFEFEVQAPLGTVVFSAVDPIEPTSVMTNTCTTTPLPDAGLLWWRARGIDDAGVTSAWSGFESFRVDDIPAPNPASLQVSMDGGYADLSCPTVTDLESGVGRYHFFPSELDPPDGGAPAQGDGRFYSPAPAIQLRLGPGTWYFGVHVHDVVDNIPPGATNAGPVTVASEPSLPPPTDLAPVRSDGGAWPSFPYLPVDTSRWRWDAGATTPTGYVMVSRVVTAPRWSHVGDGVAAPLSPSLPEGQQDVRIASLRDNAVSDWSAPTRVWVDTYAPAAPAPSAALDGGIATVRWVSVRDRYPTTTGSGVLEYRVQRMRPDASVALPNVADVPDASFTVNEAVGPGAWSWSVAAVDRAGNVASGVARLDVAPPVPGAPRVARAVTRTAVELSWDEVADGGYVTAWDVQRDGDGGVAVVAQRLGVLALQDPAPEGRWRYAVRAVVDGVASGWSPAVSVIVDQTPPVVSAPALQRTLARELRVQWVASDLESGIDVVQLERETDGVVAPLGAQVSPFTDTPPDGTHRYRAVASDLAGNTTTSGWSAAVVTPGTSVAIDTPLPAAVQCGREVQVQLTATGEPVLRWSLVEPARPGASVDEVSGLVRYRPTADDVGTQGLLVRAEAASSADEKTVTVEVSCVVEPYQVACGCDAGGGGLAVLALALLRRRRAHP